MSTLVSGVRWQEDVSEADSRSFPWFLFLFLFEVSFCLVSIRSPFPLPNSSFS